MNKGSSSAQCASTPWGMMKLELDSTYSGLNIQEKQWQDRGAPAAANQTQPSLVGEKIQDEMKSGKAIVKGQLQKVSASPWLLHEKKIVGCQPEETVGSHWVSLSHLELPFWSRLCSACITYASS